MKFFDDLKNFGFIEPEEGDEDFFVHRSEVQGETLYEGDIVEFDAEQGEKGPRAVNVRKIG